MLPGDQVRGSALVRVAEEGLRRDDGHGFAGRQQGESGVERGDGGRGSGGLVRSGLIPVISCAAPAGAVFVSEEPI